MNLLLRTLLLMMTSRRRPPLDFREVGRVRMRVLPNDTDILRHVNNGIYLSLMDLGRFDLMIRSGYWARLRKLGWYPVATNTTMTYRRSLQTWQRYVLETKVIGFDDKAMYVEQRFVSNNEVYAVGYMRGRFLKRSGGTVSVAELGELAGLDPASMPVPEWVTNWVDSIALPPSRASFPSDWDSPESTTPQSTSH
ncbi:MAG TPA: acyl-CoA thioesterase [Galbitalea sp.]|nr:acyl-CoA thioesterase [Galbitalea sp.]